MKNLTQVMSLTNSFINIENENKNIAQEGRVRGN